MKKIDDIIGKHHFLLGFSNVFPNEKALDLMSYLGGFSRKDIILAATFLISIKTRNSEFEVDNLVSKWFSKKNAKFQSELFQGIKKFEGKIRMPVVIINPITSLRIFEFAFNHLKDDHVTDDTELEVNLIKAYLALNEELTNLEHLCIDSVESVNKKINWACLNFCKNFQMHEFLQYYPAEVTLTQVVKAMHFFEFLSSKEELKWLLNTFLEYYEQNDWQSYLKAYLPFTNFVIIKTREGHLEVAIGKGELYEESCRFIEKFIVKDEESLNEYDFRSVRAKPFYKLEEGKYRVVHELFILEKTFTGLYFVFAEIYKNSDKHLKTLGEFRSFYTREFSEGYLLYNTLKSCFPKKYIHRTGEEMKTKDFSGEPDYYVRNKNKVFLFENKDILIPADIKQSCDYRILEPELKKRLYGKEENGKMKNGAVLQLIFNIKRILTAQFLPDQEVNKEYVNIYPILVLQHAQYNTAGLNKIVNYWFEIELKNLSEENINTTNVHSLTIIDIDTLILLQDYLINRQIKLEEMIETYSKCQKDELYIIPFSNLIMRFADENKLKDSPAIFKKLRQKLFDVKQAE